MILIKTLFMHQLISNSKIVEKKYRRLWGLSLFSNIFLIFNYFIHYKRLKRKFWSHENISLLRKCPKHVLKYAEEWGQNLWNRLTTPSVADCWLWEGFSHKCTKHIFPFNWIKVVFSYFAIENKYIMRVNATIAIMHNIHKAQRAF